MTKIDNEIKELREQIDSLTKQIDEVENRLTFRDQIAESVRSLKVYVEEMEKAGFSRGEAMSFVAKVGANNALR